VLLDLPTAEEAAVVAPAPAGAPAGMRVVTFNTWVGDARRGFCSRDTERLTWIERQLREVNADVMCLQEVLESDLQAWYERTFPDYEFVVLQQPSRAVGIGFWLAWTALPALLAGLAAWLGAAAWRPDELLPRAAAAAGLGGAAWWALERALTGPGFPEWAKSVAVAGFPVLGARNYAFSSNASLAIAVRREFGRVRHVQREWFEHQGLWLHKTAAGLEREHQLYNPDRALNCFRQRGILGVTVALSGGGEVRVVDVHMNIGVTNAEVRQPQMEQVVRMLGKYDGPTVLAGDTNSCANLPEPEMRWLAEQERVPLADCWTVAGDVGPGWTWHRDNPLTVGPLLEPDQRTDLVMVTKGRGLTATDCKVMVFPKHELISDHYGVFADIEVAPS